MELEIDVPNKLVLCRARKVDDWSEEVGGWGIDTKILKVLPRDYQVILYDMQKRMNYTTTIRQYRKGVIEGGRAFLSIYKFDEQ